ncbi:MAG: hypothetical protein Q8L54_16145 [Devosia sp.]|nr:hypothetical protein [Devosia sp.]
MATVKAGPTKVAAHGRFVVGGRKDAGKAKLARAAKTGKFVVVNATRFEAVMKAAAHSGLLGEKSTRIGGRISPALLEQAKKQTGIQIDTDLIEFALANVALDDDFGQTFEKVRGTVDPSLKLGF